MELCEREGSMVKIYGIGNCDTVKKAKKFLEREDVEFEFVDFKKTPPKHAWIKKWKKYHGEVPVNKRGTTFRKIKEKFENASASDQEKILVENPSAIKRPILEIKDKVYAIGFDEMQWSSLL